VSRDPEMAIDPEPAQLLRTLLATLGPNGRDPLLVTRSQIALWPPSLFNALLETTLFRPAGSAKIVVCPGCDHACAMNVNSDTHPETGNLRTFIVCDRRDDMGLIGLEPSELKQWQLSRSQLADFLVKNLSLAPSGVSVDASVIALGWTTSKHGRRHVCLQFEGAPQLSIDSGIIPLDQLVFWDGTAIAVDHESFRLIANQRPQAARHGRSSARREARKLDTRDRHLRWQKKYRHLKQEHPGWSDEAIANFIAESDPEPKRRPGTVRRYMKP
jgi:hypothetical protein